MRMLTWLVLAGLLAGCSPDKPVRIGFIGGLSSWGSDVEQDGRNGLMLAIEQRNQAGGIRGRTIELLVQDDGQNPAKALAAIQTLVAAHVDAVVGPFNSSMAVAIVPVANQARLTLVSPTVTSLDFVGKDDFLIRMGRSTRDNARDYAAKLFERGQRRVALAHDVRNASFSASWRKEFRAAYTALGGQLVVEEPFSTSTEGAVATVRHMLAAHPDGLLFVTTAVDVALLAQQAAKLAPELPKSASEWASSESLVELGGPAVEGMLTVQGFKRDDDSEPFRQFHAAYVARFAREPGFAALASFDAATVITLAMERQARGESLKEAILKHGPYPGLQQSIQFDRFGDTQRKAYFTEVRAGKFVLVP